MLWKIPFLFTLVFRIWKPFRVNCPGCALQLRSLLNCFGGCLSFTRSNWWVFQRSEFESSDVYKFGVLQDSWSLKAGLSCSPYACVYVGRVSNDRCDCPSRRHHPQHSAVQGCAGKRYVPHHTLSSSNPKQITLNRGKKNLELMDMLYNLIERDVENFKFCLEEFGRGVRELSFEFF